jgi:rSAM/selenodomain-associated transferase 1
LSLRGKRKLLVVMAKEPVPGEVKTRLLPHLSPQEAADLYLGFLRDTLSEMGKIDGIEAAIAFTPPEAKATFLTLPSDRFLLFPQRGKDLGERLSNIFSEKFQEGYEAVSIIGSDIPDLPKEIAEASFHLLANEAEVVFGPCEDGGYYLIGMRRVIPELFISIPWSTDRVLSTSLQKAKKMGIKVGLLPFWNDIDTFEELVTFYNRYQDRIRTGPWPGEETFSFLSGLEKFRNLSSRMDGSKIASGGDSLQQRKKSK